MERLDGLQALGQFCRNRDLPLERAANILLPDCYPTGGTSRGGQGRKKKALEESEARRDHSGLNGTATTEFRVRCFQPLSHLSG
jgi:hypothetical protein